MTTDSRLSAAVVGTPDTPPILRAAWACAHARLTLAPPGAWTDVADVTRPVAGLLNCSAALVGELLTVARDMDVVQLTRTPEATLVRLTTE